MPKVLVTGATGFIGRHLCSVLRALGYTVRGATRGAPSCDDATITSCDDATIKWVHISRVDSAEGWSTLLQNVDYVVHLAALAHQTSNQPSYAAYETANLGMSAALAKAVSASDVRRFVYVSSIGAVRTYSDEWLTEDSECKPDTHYGRTKRLAELAISDVLGRSAVEYCIVRPTLVYGAGNPGNMARLMDLVSTGLPLPFAWVRNSRSFAYVGNLTDTIARCLTHSAAARQVFNVCDDGCLSTPELIRSIGGLMQKKVRMFGVPVALLRAAAVVMGRQSEIDRLSGSLRVDNSKIKTLLGWTPPYSAAEGLAETARWYFNSKSASRD